MRLASGRAALMVAAAVAVSAGLHARVPVLDGDSFFHYRFAERYGREGPLASGFPWIPLSVMGREGGDIWYGFHVALSPLASGADPLRRLEWIGILLTAGVLASFGAALAMVRAPAWGAWPFVALFSAPNVLGHLLMARPHVASLSLLILLWACLVRGSPWGIAAAAAALASVHLTLAWAALVVGAAVLPFRGWAGRRGALRDAWILGLGLLVGWLARPRPLGTARIDYVQLVDLLIEKRRGTPLSFGQELYPLSWDRLLGAFAPLLAVWAAATVAAAVAVARRREADPDALAAVGSGAVLSALFLAMTMLVARRAYDPWAAFTVALAATSAGHLLGPDPGARRRRLLGAAVAALALLLAWRHVPRVAAARGQDPRLYEGACRWIAAHGEDGDVVYHVAWHTFPRLLLWNDRNRYVAGIDPIFQYAYSPDLYWKGHHLEAGTRPGHTCGAPECAPDAWEEAATVLSRDFHARFLLVETRRHPLFRAAREDPRLVLRYEEGDHAVFEILGAVGPEAEGTAPGAGAPQASPGGRE